MTTVTFFVNEMPKFKLLCFVSCYVLAGFLGNLVLNLTLKFSI